MSHAKLEYQDAIVTFIDLLGFRDLVATRSASDIAKAIGLFRRAGGDERREEEALGLTVVAFSDSIIRIRRADTVSGLFMELLQLLHAQGALVSEGVLLRGGVAFGKVAVAPDQIFGPAFVEAYELESQFAVYPRIAVSPRLLKEFAAGALPFVNHHDLAEEASHISELLAHGDDGVWYLDYLNAYLSELDEPELSPKWLARHAEIIRGLGARAAGGEARMSTLFAKANWLARYQNRIVDRYADWLESIGVETTALRITPDDLPTFVELEPYMRKPSKRQRSARKKS